MSLLERLTGATPEKREQKADRLLAAGRWGEAKLAYEDALAKLTRRPDADTDSVYRLNAKIHRSRRAMAREHRQSADDLMEGGYWEEAREMLVLAIEVSPDEAERRELIREREALDDRWPDKTAALRLQPQADVPHPDTATPEGSEDEYFLALCHTLPDHVRRAYLQYGEDFKRGYIALNRGDFETAARRLEQAYQDTPQPESHIPLELATAYLNLDRKTEARDLLTGYHRHYPDALPAYRLLCEIYWEQGDFTLAIELLDALPPELSTSLAAVALRGETLERAGQHANARDYYRRFIATYGWDPRIAHRLARICRDQHETEEALDLYRQIVEGGRSCGTRIEPQIRHEYAELCFETGAHDVALLELYLALAREIPHQAAGCYRRVADIYARQGHASEARRFRDFARQIGAAPAGNSRENEAP